MPQTGAPAGNRTSGMPAQQTNPVAPTAHRAASTVRGPAAAAQVISVCRSVL